MAEIETLGILEEIETLVSDRLQVVSYKWLSRNFLVSSDAAKKLLEDFVRKNNGGLEVMYAVAGWLKRNPPTYNARLVPGSKLAEAKQDFDDSCSVQVYSVQACVPKDPATLWNAEFVQAEELFKQMLTVDNCLRDNRFSGVSNSFVKRNADGASVGIAVPQPKSAAALALSRGSSANHTNAVPQPQQKNLQQASPKAGLPFSNTTSVKNEADHAGAHDLASKPASNREKVALPRNRNKGQSGTSSSGSGGSLANFFGHSSTKLKSTNVSAEANNAAPKTNEAQICAREALEGVSSDDDGQNVNFKRVSSGDVGKKRRVILDDSDEEVDYQNAVSLASPDPPKVEASLEKNRTLDVERIGLDFNEQTEDQLELNKKKAFGIDLKQHSKKDSSILEQEISSGVAASDCSRFTNGENKKDKAADLAPGSPKRRKVLKTRIDERGREVNEVVWEGEEMQMRNSDDTGNHTAKSEDNTGANPVNRPAAVKKSPAVGSTGPHPVGKAGNKKGGIVKDPKQGNILSFFKRA
ncbi:hypothetical protein Ancab_004132 [Ancistrocladus abbreviatus]